MKIKEGTFLGVGGTELFYRVTIPDVIPNASVIVVHGHGHHSGGVGIICERLATQGYIAYSIDLHGHGKSSGMALINFQKMMTVNLIGKEMGHHSLVRKVPFLEKRGISYSTIILFDN